MKIFGEACMRRFAVLMRSKSSWSKMSGRGREEEVKEKEEEKVEKMARRKFRESKRE
jgi:hypothetical protein